MSPQIQTESMKTIASYAAMMKVTTSYIYKLIGQGKLKPVEIDGVKFIDINKYPKLPT
jgi:hypothetical protein